MAQTSVTYFSVLEVGQSKIKVPVHKVIDESPLGLQNHLLIFSHGGKERERGRVMGRGRRREKAL